MIAFNLSKWCQILTAWCQVLHEFDLVWPIRRIAYFLQMTSYPTLFRVSQMEFGNLDTRNCSGLQSIEEPNG